MNDDPTRISTRRFALWWELARRWFNGKFKFLAKESTLNANTQTILTKIETTQPDLSIVAKEQTLLNKTQEIVQNIQDSTKELLKEETLLQFFEDASEQDIINMWEDASKCVFYTAPDQCSITSSTFGSTIISHTFENGKGIVILQNSPTTVSNSAFIDQRTITSLILPNTITSIGTDAFRRCYALQHVSLPTSLTTISNSAFRGSGIVSLDIPDTVTSIGEYAFLDSDLTSIAFPSSLTTISAHVCESCSKLKYVTIPSSITQIETSAFYGCSNLKKVFIEDLAAWCDIEFVTASSNPLYYAHRLVINGEEKVNIVIPYSVNEISAYAFYNYSGAASIKVLRNDITIGTNAFYHVKNVITSMSTHYGELNYNAYVEGLGIYTQSTKSDLLGCASQAKTFTMNSGLVGPYAFEHCDDLDYIISLQNSPPEVESTAFDRNHIVYVPTASVADYKNSPYWSRHTIKSIEEL